MDTINKKISGIGSKDGKKVVHQYVEEVQESNANPHKVLYASLFGGAFVILSSAGFFIYKYLNPTDTNVAEVKTQTQVKQAKKVETTEVVQILNQEQSQKVSVNLNPTNRDEQYSLALRYLNGDGVNKNYMEAIKWLNSAATQEQKDAQAMLGKIYYYGEFVKPDFKKALMWNTFAAIQGVTEAQYVLGVMYEEGNGVVQDRKEARKWFELAAAQGLEAAKNKISVNEQPKEEKVTELKKSAKLVTQDDLSEVNKYLSRVEKESNKQPVEPPKKDREIIWN